METTTVKRGRGRPPVDGETRDERIMVRLTADELRLLEEVAQQAGMSVSAWTRAVATHAAAIVQGGV